MALFNIEGTIVTKTSNYNTETNKQIYSTQLKIKLTNGRLRNIKFSYKNIQSRDIPHHGKNFPLISDQYVKLEIIEQESEWFIWNVIDVNDNGFTSNKKKKFKDLLCFQKVRLELGISNFQMDNLFKKIIK